MTIVNFNNISTENINSTGVSTFSTLKATTITGVSTAGITTAYITNINNGPLSGTRNIVINGAMDINQRGWTGAAGTTTHNSYVTDRFIIQHNQGGVVSAGQTSMNSTVGGNAYADGFQNALFFNVTTADASLAAGEYYNVLQFIEGFNVQGIKKGTVNALPVTLSFWCRSTTTGTYIVELVDSNSRAVSQAYTINTANTWEKKVLTFPADTIGTLNNDNSKALTIDWWLAAGSTYSSGTLNTSWASVASANRAVGQTNLLATVGNNFWLTGVQLEVGSVATPFERRSYGQELALCQRYYEQGDLNGVITNYFAGGYNVHSGYYSWKVVKRTSPSVSAAAIPNYQPGGGSGSTNTFGNITIYGGRFDSGSTNSTFPAQWINGTSIFGISAEL